jgi:cytochrome P450
MSFLAPHALTIAHGEEWSRLRSFHDKALVFGPAHPFAPAFLERTRAAFAQPVRTLEEARSAMGQAMLGIVLGAEGGRHADVPDDVHALFQALQSPLRRRLRGGRYRAMREALYTLLRERLDRVGEGEASLVALARRYSSNGAGPMDGEHLVQQLPHWMFTFTGSGTDLLTRTLAMVTARPHVHRRARAEIAAAGPADEPGTVFGLEYVRALLLETGRLFPPVARTFHRGEEGDVVHYFPLLHRDQALGPTVHHFRPERWLEPEGLDAAAAASSLFLRGPRSCPGRDLILFVCMAAMARQLGELGMGDRSSPLSRDPLPITFPAGEARFQTGGPG